MSNLKLSGDKAFWDKMHKLASPVFKRKLVDEAGITALRFSKQRFRQKNWVDKGMPENWEKRKRKARGSILVRSGRLKRSIRVISKGRFYVQIGTDVPYAKIHNEGGRISKTVKVRSHTRKRSGRDGSGSIKVRSHQRKMNTTIPQRQFIGSSKALADKIEKKLKKKIDKQLNKRL